MSDEDLRARIVALIGEMPKLRITDEEAEKMLQELKTQTEMLKELEKIDVGEVQPATIFTRRDKP